MSARKEASSSRKEADKEVGDPGCLQFDYEELREATNNFDPRPFNQGGCKLGEGGFGPVFKGRLKFTEVAIKILRTTPKVHYRWQPDLVIRKAAMHVFDSCIPHPERGCGEYCSRPTFCFSCDVVCF